MRIKIAPLPVGQDGPRTGMLMTPPELSLAVLALLLTPGPTNALMLLAGAERGLAGAARLSPVALAGHFLTVLPLAVAGATALASVWLGGSRWC